jgi:hypothetical protein
LENKPFQIDANILSNKKKSNKSVNKNTNSNKTKKGTNRFFSFFSLCLIVIVGVGLFINYHKNNMVKEFLDGRTLVCKDRLVSKEQYVLNKNENAFINKKEGLYLSSYFCFEFEK